MAATTQRKWEIELSDLPDFCSKPILVLGCGNTLFGDDGFGCAVIDYLEAHYRVPEAVCLLDVGTGVRKLLFTLCLSPVRPERLIILDAIDAGRTPGEVFEIDPAEIPVAKLDDFSLHQLPTSNLLCELQETCGVVVRVLACQTGPLPAEISEGLSEAVSKAVPRAAEWLVRQRFPQRSPEVLMADEQCRMESFRAFIKTAEERATIPTVSEDDLRRLHEYCVEMSKRYCGKDGVVTVDTMARICSTEANLPAVWLRHIELRSLWRHGLLDQWQQGATLDNTVFRVAATIAINGLHLDKESFFQELQLQS
jgi:coenzyme F420 hydrogenase subunit delta